eukprot:3014729-Amphidinium_carterae.1
MPKPKRRTRRAAPTTAVLNTTTSQSLMTKSVFRMPQWRTKMRTVAVRLSMRFTRRVRQGCKVAWNMPKETMIPQTIKTWTPTFCENDAGTKHRHKLRSKRSNP